MTKYGILKGLIKTSSCCPSQWEGRTDKNEFVYVRYRWGCLTIEISKPNGNIGDAINDGRLIHSEQIGDGLDGVMNGEELKKIILENDLFEI